MEARSVAAVSLPLLFASLTGRSGHGLARRLMTILMYRFGPARPLGGFGVHPDG